MWGCQRSVRPAICTQPALIQGQGWGSRCTVECNVQGLRLSVQGLIAICTPPGSGMRGLRAGVYVLRFPVEGVGLRVESSVCENREVLEGRGGLEGGV